MKRHQKTGMAVISFISRIVGDGLSDIPPAFPLSERKWPGVTTSLTDNLPHPTPTTTFRRRGTLVHRFLHPVFATISGRDSS